MTILSFDFTSKILKEKNYPQHSHDDLEKKFNGFLSALEDYESKGELIKSELKDLSESTPTCNLYGRVLYVHLPPI